MQDIRALVVEDNPLHLEKIEVLLEDLGIELSGRADNALDALDLLQSVKPDIILLDIHLTGSFSGIDFAERVRKSNDLPIIYISSLRDRETFDKALSTSPDAFVYKPLNEDDLMAAIEIALHRNQLARQAGDNGKHALDEALFVKVGNALKKVKWEDIVYIQASAKNYCDIRTTAQHYAVKSSLNDLLALLPPNHFMRVSRSYILNLNFIREINEKGQWIETGFEPVTLGAGYKAELYEKIRQV